MTMFEPGRVLLGDADRLPAGIDAWAGIPVDQEFAAPEGWQPAACRTTLAASFYANGPSTYSRKNNSTLYFEPSSRDGWWVDRIDLKEQLPIRVSVRNVWDTSRSVVLRSGSAHNYFRMAEHVIAARLGLGLDDVVIRADSGDPPLFNAGSMPIVEGAEAAGIVERPGLPLTYWSVKEPVTVLRENGGFLHLEPARSGSRVLSVDCAVDFPTAIGRQRIRFDVCPAAFRHGAQARTNCTRLEWWLVRTAGKLFADMRNLGYTHENILIAGRRGYLNKAKLVHEGRSLEAVWHRATLDLVAALSLLEEGRLAGRIISYKAGHALDVRLVQQLVLHDLLEPMA